MPVRGRGLSVGHGRSVGHGKSVGFWGLGGLILEVGHRSSLPTGRTPAVVRANLKLLQKAMAHGGFYGLRTEWWHFCAADWKRFDPVPAAGRGTHNHEH